ncbi:MAG: phenylalanine--tRNA ligase subunit beta [Balneolaceae bacterium]
MKISYNWLKNYIDIQESPEEIAEKLTLLGLEVEEIEQTGSDFEGIVVGEVLEVKSHPNADRLQICDVNLGEETVQIICGAKNVASGQKVPVATIGSTLPMPMKDGSYLTIKKTKLRGEASNGMICSESELGISDDHSGIMVLDEELNIGIPFTDVHPANKDTVFEIGLTPNRPDAACHIGVARDLSAVLKRPYSNPYSENTSIEGTGHSKEINIHISDTDKCHRYVGVIVDNVEVKESPDWLKQRLISIGSRPINNIVDVTNYVLHEIGQPLHAFDYDLIKDQKIDVRSFKEEFLFTTLDSVKRKVPAGSLFICDGSGPVAIAGVMGGENSEVTEKTRKILIESAWFVPSSIRLTSKSLALQTDSSYRFERGIDPNLQLNAAMRAAQLIAELSGGTLSKEYLDVHPVKSEPVIVDLRVSRVNHLLGTDLEEQTVTEILESLEIKTKSNQDDLLNCTIPTFRPDITREVDLIEEVGRVFDYNNIPTPVTVPFYTPEPISSTEKYHQMIKEIARSLGYKEITTNSLLSKKEALLLDEEEIQIDTVNPVSQENTTLRTRLSAGFLKAVRYNLNRNAETIRFFEIGHIFKKSDNSTWIPGIHEHVHLMLGLCGNKKSEDWRGKKIPFSIFDLKSDLEALFKQLGFLDQLKSVNEENHRLNYQLNDQIIAQLVIVDENLSEGFDVEEETYLAEIDLTLLFNLETISFETSYKPIAKFPTFEFDAAFIVEKSVRAGEMTHEIRNTAGSILRSVSVFDVYEGENLGKEKKSIAFRLTFLDSNKTLNIKDVEPVVQKVVQRLDKVYNAKLRS